MGKTIKIRRGTLANIPVLQEGEPGWVTDTNALYIGDGSVNHAIGGSSSSSLSIKVGTITRVMNADPGAVPYTGVGFEPSAVFFIAAVQTTSISTGFSDGTTSCVAKGFNVGGTTILFAGGTGACISLHESAVESQEAELTAFGSDGFTLTWSRSGSPTGTEITITYLAIG